MAIIILILTPLLDIFIHRLFWRINKGLYIDMYIPIEDDREKMWEVLKENDEEDNKLDLWEHF